MAASKPNKEMIGKGLRSLLQNINEDIQATGTKLAAEAAEKATVSTRIPVGAIRLNPKQPRRDFDATALQELAASVKLHDIIQPLTVSKNTDGSYQLIAGERRLRAATLAGLTDVPAYVRQANDQQLLEWALLENLQRENLNAIETALSFKRMMEELNYTQEQVAERMGKERSTVTNYIRLLKLPPDIMAAIRNGSLSMGHARALVNIDTVDRQLFVFKEILRLQLSVRQTEELVRKMYKAQKPGAPAAAASSLPPAFQKIQDKLSSHFGTKVNMAHSPKGHGSIQLEYYSLEELNKILDLLQISIG